MNQLDGLCVRSRAQQSFAYLGIDSPVACLDRGWFQNYPYDICYQFNTRGFRDQEWPTADLESCIWCLGDSFTVGVGQPLEHTWPQILSQLTGKRCINVSMDGASNAWIARRARQILETIQPRLMIIHWSFTHRREDPDNSLPDELRRIWHSDKDDDDDVDFINHVQNVEHHRNCTHVIHSTIPWFSANSIMRKLALEKHVKDGCWIAHFDFLDRARDGYHYGPLTASWLAQALANLIA